MNFCPICKHKTQKILTNANTSICTECGLEKQQCFDLSKEPYDWTRVPCITCYSRKKRFAKLFDHTICPYAEQNDTPMLEYLAKQGSIQTIKELISKIKRSGLKDKRYGSIHIFSKLFVKTYQKPKTPTNMIFLRKTILRRFEDFEFAHKRYRAGNFFNYRWLLARLLREFKLFDFLRFIKKLKCPHRCKFYNLMFTELSGLLRTCPSSTVI